jgi:Ca2+-transporting ATPase
LRGIGIYRARTITANVFIFTEIFYLFNNRSLNLSALRNELFINVWAFADMAAMVNLQMLFTYLPEPILPS